jgi:putative phage-type endonuclease
MRLIECEQGTEEWHAARLGRVTASRVTDVIAKTKSGYSTSRANYMAELVAERLTGTAAQAFVNDAMRRGSEVEPEARAAYEITQGLTVKQIGFVLHPDIDMAGASPDGLVGETGLIEIKCPNTATHIATLLGGSVPAKYNTQMQWQMACTGRTWCDWVSYDPRLPTEMQMYVERVERDDAMISSLAREIETFLSEVSKTVDQLVAKYGQQAA